VFFIFIFHRKFQDVKFWFLHLIERKNLKGDFFRTNFWRQGDWLEATKGSCSSWKPNGACERLRVEWERRERGGWFVQTPKTFFAAARASKTFFKRDFFFSKLNKAAFAMFFLLLLSSLLNPSARERVGSVLRHQTHFLFIFGSDGFHSGMGPIPPVLNENELASSNYHNDDESKKQHRLVLKCRHYCLILVDFMPSPIRAHCSRNQLLKHNTKYIIVLVNIILTIS